MAAIVFEHRLYFDTETYCETPIKNGTHRYAEDVQITIAAWALDDGPIHVEDLTTVHEDGSVTCSLPSDDLLHWLHDPKTEVVIHKSDFDRNVVKEAWYEAQVHIPLERTHDTMVRALAHGLPGGLERLSEIYKLDEDEAKHKDGKTLINLLCKPRPKNMKVRRANKVTHPNEWQRFMDYAGADVGSMRIIYGKLPRWNYKGRELDLWRLDQRINERGFKLDVPAAHAAVAAIADEQKRLRGRVVEITGGELTSTTKRDATLAYILKEFGVDLPDMKKDTLERRLADEELPSAVRELIRLRLSQTTTSTAKYPTVLRCVSTRDDRLRGGVQFCGAKRTGRWGGRLFQPQNMMRPDPDWSDQSRIEAAFSALYAGCLDLNEDVMKALSNIMRGMIVAPEGKKLVAADLSNIEGRVAAWLAGEEWKLDAFAEIDEGQRQGLKLPDMYCRAYASAFSVTPEAVMANYKAGGFWRQVGKVMELALGYEGGVAAFLAFAAVYRLDLDAMADLAYPLLPDAVRQQAEIILNWRKKKGLSIFGLREKTFVVCESFKTAWRDGHEQISSYWGELDEAAKKAVLNPGKEVKARRLTFVRLGAWLYIILPSGRRLCYLSPRIEDKKLTYMGENQYTRRWQRLGTYGGKLFENCLTGDTLVLTERGWIAITDVRLADRVWDGDQWVAHGGVIAKGEQVVGRLDGVGMTADHQVLTTNGWVGASSCERFDRAAVALPDSHSVRGVGRAKITMEYSLRLWGGVQDGRDRISKRSSEVVRLSAWSANRYRPHKTRHVSTPGVRRVALNDRSLRVENAPILGKLWRAWDQSMRSLAQRIFGFLGRHGANVSQRFDTGAHQQRAWVLPKKLSVGDAPRASAQHPVEPNYRHTERPDVALRSGGCLGPWVLDAVVSSEPRLASKHDVPATSPRQPVFDVMNAGPQHRFTVLGFNGPMIVHNCCQAVARDVMAWNMPLIEEAGYPIVLTVHDEVITEVVDTPAYSSDILSGLLATNPPWLPGCPLNAGGFEAHRYRKD